jgi:hypothetical protein
VQYGWGHHIYLLAKCSLHYLVQEVWLDGRVVVQNEDVVGVLILQCMANADVVPSGESTILTIFQQLNPPRPLPQLNQIFCPRPIVYYDDSEIRIGDRAKRLKALGGVSPSVPVENYYGNPGLMCRHGWASSIPDPNISPDLLARTFSVPVGRTFTALRCPNALRRGHGGLPSEGGTDNQ